MFAQPRETGEHIVDRRADRHGVDRVVEERRATRPSDLQHHPVDPHRRAEAGPDLARDLGTVGVQDIEDERRPDPRLGVVGVLDELHERPDGGVLAGGVDDVEEVLPDHRLDRPPEQRLHSRPGPTDPPLVVEHHEWADRRLHHGLERPVRKFLHAPHRLGRYRARFHPCMGRPVLSSAACPFSASWRAVSHVRAQRSSWPRLSDPLRIVGHDFPRRSTVGGSPCSSISSHSPGRSKVP